MSDKQALPYNASYRSEPPITIQPQQQTIMIQPQSLSYMINNISPGLESLPNIDQLFINAKKEVHTGFETKNKYQIFDNAGQPLFFAKEDTDFCTRNVFGPLRPFEMKIQDGGGIEVIHLNRPFACQGYCFPCCLQSIAVHTPPGNIVGTVEEEWSCMVPRFLVKDASENVVLRIEACYCTMSCGKDVEFRVLSADGAMEVGKISKKWSGLFREFLTDADNFGIHFPMDLDVKIEAVKIGACILIDFMFFATSN